MLINQLLNIRTIFVQQIVPIVLFQHKQVGTPLCAQRSEQVFIDFIFSSKGFCFSRNNTLRNSLQVLVIVADIVLPGVLVERVCTWPYTQVIFLLPITAVVLGVSSG